ncbi:hypothetical protein ZIOFF_032242 [Zingiber officinale]|uniref:Uncharacterized protein n=1 Tax=Zingiber officinale TaxID=94328 RepID=A0A8J5GNJ1_ZINOF|nr:hypothetical protein ZIOFF_032242 [Zingiber officinale]
MAAVVGILESIGLIFGLGVLMDFMGIAVDSPMRLPAEQFLTLRAFGAPAIVIALAAQGTFRGFKDTKTPLYAVFGFLVGRTIAVLITMTISTSMAAREGPVPMASHQICLQVWLVISLLNDALALTGQALLASEYTKKNYKQARIIVYRVLQVLIGLISSAFLLMAAPVFGLAGVSTGLVLFMSLQALAGIWSSPQPPVLGGDCDDPSKPRSTAGGGRICFKETASFAGLGQPLRLFGLSRCSLDRPFCLPDLAARSAPSFAQSASSLARSSALGTLGWSHYSHDQPVLLLARSTTCSARSTFSPRGLCCFDTLLT